MNPKPGSPEAVDRGCRCPIYDNAHGLGSIRGGFIIAESCPLHWHEYAPDFV